MNGVLLDHLDGFVTTRRSIETWLEWPTSFNRPSILLVAVDGESTRYAIPSIAPSHDFASRHDVPIYDVDMVPYPQRMCEYGARNKRIFG